MKALELTVYPPLKRPRYGDGIEPYRKQWKREEKLKQAKRLTAAELAAEYWFQMWGLLPFIKNGKANTRGKAERQQILRRFATLPHYDEATP